MKSIFVNKHIELRFLDNDALEELVHTDDNGECLFHLKRLDSNRFWSRFYSTKQHLLEHDVIVNFNASYGFDEIILKAVVELEPNSITKQNTLLLDDAVLKIVLGSLVKRHGLKAVNEVIKHLTRLTHALDNYERN